MKISLTCANSLRSLKEAGASVGWNARKINIQTENENENNGFVCLHCLSIYRARTSLKLCIRFVCFVFFFDLIDNLFRSDVHKIRFYWVQTPQPNCNESNKFHCVQLMPKCSFIQWFDRIFAAIATKKQSRKKQRTHISAEQRFNFISANSFPHTL